MKAMTKESFWDLISDMKAACGQNMDASCTWMEEKLIELGPEQAQAFHDIFHGYQYLADQYGLWSAASVMNENGCSDDGFTYFRAWLIAQGKETYLAALANPDSLADVEPYGGCRFEKLAYAGDKALEALTGQSAYDGTDYATYDAMLEELKADICYGEGIGYPYEWNEVEAHFPRLCAKYLNPGTVGFMLDCHETIWALDNPAIQEARQGGPSQEDSPQIDMTMGGF